MKKSIIATALGFIAIMSMFIACGEADTSFNQILWSGSWIMVSFVCGKGSSKLINEIEKEEK